MQGLKLLGFLSGAVPAHHHSHDTEAFPSPSDPNAAPPSFAAHAFAALQAADTELALGLQGDVYALDLLRLLLHPDPVMRISADEALRHPYFTSSRPRSPLPLPPVDPGVLDTSKRRATGAADVEMEVVASVGSLELGSATAADDRARELERVGATRGMKLAVDTAADSSGGAGPGIAAARHSPVVYGTALAQGLRAQMEDCCVVAPLLEGQYLLAACLDGHNGAQVRATAALHGVQPAADRVRGLKRIWVVLCVEKLDGCGWVRALR